MPVTNITSILSILYILLILGKGRGELKTVNSKLTTEQQQLDFTESVHNIIMEETDNGRTIVEFLLAVMQGKLPDFKECHRMDAARLLEKFGHVTVGASGLTSDQPATRRERRDARRADRRIQTELSQIVKEETDNGRTIVQFLHSTMQGELADFKPHHRMSASRELLRQGSQYVLVEEEAEPVETPEEEAKRLRREENKRLLEESIEYSLHGKTYYAVYTFPCPCEDRLHDCKGNELSEEEHQKAIRLAPAREDFIHSNDTLEAFKERYKAYLARLNPGKDLFSIIRWKDDP